MKFYSETLNKLFDSEKELKMAEKSYEDKNLQKENTKKELSKKIEAAEVAVDEAYKNYEEARKYAAKLMDESNKEIIKIMNDAKAKVTESEKARTDAIVQFNQQFGTYRANYTGERAQREQARVNKMVEDLFSMCTLF
jgi:DNA-directed RNA polymerase alpha subunit